MFDTLDLDVFCNQKWDRLPVRQSTVIVVTWPDGHVTRGIGTFSTPMPLADGKTIQSTGKRLAIGMATTGHLKDETVDDEWLFRDFLRFLDQQGLGTR